MKKYIVGIVLLALGTPLFGAAKPAATVAVSLDDDEAKSSAESKSDATLAAEQELVKALTAGLSRTAQQEQEQKTLTSQKIKGIIENSYIPILFNLADALRGRIGKEKPHEDIPPVSLKGSLIALLFTDMGYSQEKIMAIMTAAVAYSKALRALQELPAEQRGSFSHESPEYQQALKEYLATDAYKAAENKLRTDWLNSREGQELLASYYTLYYQKYTQLQDWPQIPYPQDIINNENLTGW